MDRLIGLIDENELYMNLSITIQHYPLGDWVIEIKRDDDIIVEMADDCSYVAAAKAAKKLEQYLEEHL